MGVTKYDLSRFLELAKYGLPIFDRHPCVRLAKLHPNKPSFDHVKKKFLYVGKIEEIIMFWDELKLVYPEIFIKIEKEVKQNGIQRNKIRTSENNRQHKAKSNKRGLNRTNAKYKEKRANATNRCKESSQQGTIHINMGLQTV